MPTLLDHHEIRPRDSLVIEGPTFHRDDLILPSPNDACGRRDPGEQRRQARVVHIGLPGQPDDHLAVLHRLFAFGWTRLRRVELGIFRDLLRIVKHQVANLRRAQDEQISDFALVRLDAGRIDEEVLPRGSAGPFTQRFGARVATLLADDPNVAGVAPALESPNVLLADVSARPVAASHTMIFPD